MAIWQATVERWGVWQEGKISIFQWGSSAPEWEARQAGEPADLALASRGVYALTTTQLVWLPYNRYEPKQSWTVPAHTKGLILWDRQQHRLLLWDDKGQVFTCDASGSFSRPFRVDPAPVAQAVAQNEKAVVLATNQGALLWVEGTEVRRRWLAHSGGLTSLRFHPSNSNQLLTTGYDGLIILWDVPTGKYLKAMAGHKGIPLNAAFLRDPSYVITIGDDGLTLLWELSRPNLPVAYADVPNTGEPRLLQMDRQGRVWLVTDGAIHRWEDDRRRWQTIRLLLRVK